MSTCQCSFTAQYLGIFWRHTGGCVCHQQPGIRERLVITVYLEIRSAGAKEHLRGTQFSICGNIIIGSQYILTNHVCWNLRIYQRHPEEHVQHKQHCIGKKFGILYVHINYVCWYLVQRSMCNNNSQAEAERWVISRELKPMPASAQGHLQGKHHSMCNSNRQVQ